ncbi:MAG: beta-galactosidase [Bacteroidaceae bacterium]|nr:beta-galactosidase [Bacteroidaceae bacterium]
MILRHLLTALALTGAIGANASPTPSEDSSLFGQPVTWDRHSLLINGQRLCGVMGEVHYSRIPANEWRQEVQKMKAGGITMIACYVFWNHIEELENQFDWSGQRNLRAFLEICKEEGLPVVLRMGPFCHGEVRNGGIPDWVVTSGCKLRSEDERFLAYAQRLYRQIFTQVQGLQWKDGGPVVAAQFDNEYGGHGSYLLALKRIALAIGFDLPFYTRTGWPELASPVPFGEMIPLYGDYADGFWDRSIREGAGSYWKAFHFSASPTSGAIGSEQLDYSASSQPSTLNPQLSYPYFTCELGGGMMQSYHRRIYTYPADAYAMAVVKLGSGSNLLGYYMYHGGTNPYSKVAGTYLNETQRCLATNYNDLPVLSYDFQAPLGEFGQVNPHYFLLRKLHLFMQDYGTLLAPMEAVFPVEAAPKKGDDSHLRWSYRKADGPAAFVFVNNYERFANLTPKANVQFEVSGVTFPSKPITIPAATACIFPVNVDGIRYATAQLIAHRDGKIYLEQIPGIPTEIAMQDGKVLKNVKARGLARPVYQDIYLIDSETAGQLGLELPVRGLAKGVEQPVTLTRVQTSAAPRTITTGAKKVAEEPTDADFDAAAVYRIDLPTDSSFFTPHSSLLKINYRGDVARLYAITQEGDAKKAHLIDDNFYNGLPFLYGLWRLPAGCHTLELRILPLQKDMPVYFPREADTTPGEAVISVTIQELF